MGLQFVTEPTVWLVAETEVNAGAVGEYLDRASVGAERWPTDATSDGDFLAEFAGRICYHSFGNPRPGGNAAYLERIKDQGHGSVLEHATYTLLLTGVSRSLTGPRRTATVSRRSPPTTARSEVGTFPADRS